MVVSVSDDSGYEWFLIIAWIEITWEDVSAVACLTGGLRTTINWCANGASSYVKVLIVTFVDVEDLVVVLLSDAHVDEERSSEAFEFFEAELTFDGRLIEVKGIATRDVSRCLREALREVVVRIGAL
jgi:hypothetical protein